MNHSTKKYIVNILTILRIIGIPFIFIITNNVGLFIYVNFLFVTDFLDGFLARKWNTVSNKGAILDLLADKFLVIFLLTLALYGGHVNVLLWILIVGREIYSIALRITSMRKNSKLINASFLGKLKTAFQFIALDALILDLDIALFLLWIVVFLSYWSIARYSITARKESNE